MKTHTLYRLTFYICLLFLTLRINAQDIVIKNDGTEIKAKVLEINETEVKFKRFDYIDGPTIILPKSELISIKYPNGNVETFKNSNTVNSKTNQLSNISILNRDTLLQTFYPTGELFSETNYLSGKINGIQKLYYKNGKIISVTTFIDGLADGTSKVYHKNGELSRDIPYVKGNITGEIKFYNKKGKCIGSENYIENKSYHKNGKLHVEYPYSNGNITGIVKGYSKNGNYEDMPYINNLNIGTNKVYNEEGKLLIQIDYEDGEKIANRSGYLTAVLQGMQGGLAYYNMQTNRNNQNIDAYAKVVTNNVTKKPEDAITENNMILESSTSNSQNNAVNVESSASTNGGTISGKDGNSPEGIACSKEAKLEYEKTKEYHDFYDNRNNINAPLLRYGELAKAKNAEVLLNHCGQYLKEHEKAALKKMIDSCRKTAADMSGNTIKH